MDVTIRYADTPRVFGALLVAQRAELVARVGGDTLARALAKLPAALRTEYEATTEETWCTSDTVERVMLATAREAGLDARALVDETVYRAIKGSIGRRWWRGLLVLTTDFSLLGRTPMFYARSYDRGSLSGERLAPGRAELWLDGWPDVPDLHLVAIAAGVRAVLELAGRAEVTVTFGREAERTRFELGWKP